MSTLIRATQNGAPQPNHIGVQGWNAVDQFERNAGREQGLVRVKLTHIDYRYQAAR